MSFDLKKAVSILTNEGGSIYDKAIQLYAFKISILYSRALNSSSGEDDNIPSKEINHLNAPTYARRFATLKLLAHLQRIITEDANQKRSLTQFRRNPDYKRLSNKLVNKYGGWQGLILLPSKNDFNSAVEERIIGATTIAAAIDFSIRLNTNRPLLAKPFKLNRTRALHAVRNLSCYSMYPAKHRAQNNYWNEHRYGAGFIYLYYFQRFPIGVLDLNNRKFANTLIKEANNTTAMRAFFSTYEQVVGTLENQIKLPSTGFTKAFSQILDAPPLPDVNHLTDIYPDDPQN